MTPSLSALGILALSLAAPPAAPAPAPAASDVATVLKTIDQRQEAAGDVRSLVRLEFRPKKGPEVVFEVMVLRRASDRRLVLLWTRPKEHAGKGYLRLGDNLWFYDPNIGKWERRTDRTRLSGTDTRRSDLDAWNLASDYEASDEGWDKVGAVPARKLLLKTKAGVDRAFPMMRLWVDKDLNPLKREDYSLSNKLLRTTYFPSWKTARSPAKNADVWYFTQMLIYDEVEKDNSTVVLVKSVDFGALEPNTFTKAWLEAQSR